MKRSTIAVSFALGFVLAAGSAGIARGGQSSSTTTSSSKTTSSHKSTKHKHYTKHQPPGQKAPTSDRVSEIQSALAHEGYYQADPNGKMDSNTVAALQKFQSANGLDANGKLDAPTLQKLGLGSQIAGVSAPRPVVPSCCAMPGANSTPTGTPAGACCSMSAPAASSGSTSSSVGTPASAITSDPKPDQK
jgi:hypothetical protein